MTDYALLDIGGGEKLERFGGATVVRPAPAADCARQLPPADWAGASLRFTRPEGWAGAAPPDWTVSLAGVTLALHPGGGGGIGVFPEHAAVADSVIKRLTADGGALNLFAHTGQLTLRLAAAGMAVAHVDSSPAAVRAARGNAVLSGLADRPVRWLVDDALVFLRRAVRRGDRYSLVAADPPAYGRGGKSRGGKGGGDWKLTRDLPGLMALAGQVLTPGGRLCLTCHGADWTAQRLTVAAREVFPEGETDADELSLATPDGRKLPAGVMVLVQKGR